MAQYQVVLEYDRTYLGKINPLPVLRGNIILCACYSISEVTREERGRILACNYLFTRKLKHVKIKDRFSNRILKRVCPFKRQRLVGLSSRLEALFEESKLSRSVKGEVVMFASRRYAP